MAPEFLELFFCTINFRLDRKSCLNTKNQLETEKTLFFSRGNTKIQCFVHDFPEETPKVKKILMGYKGRGYVPK